ncbi:hypothetical protein DW953_08390 [Ruminococcus sp. AM45-2]|nr:hypothetical protein DW953_08390 [Ruminococcus sp. AM45-2]
MMKEKKLSQMILKLHDRAEAAKYDGDSSPPYQEVKMLNFHDEESVVHTVLEDFYAVGALADELTHGSTWKSGATSTARRSIPG